MSLFLQNHWSLILTTIQISNKLKNLKKTIIKCNIRLSFKQRQNLAIIRITISHIFLTNFYLISKGSQPICDTYHKTHIIKLIIKKM